MIYFNDLRADTEGQEKTRKNSAEREGFEPSVTLRLHRFSRPAPDLSKDQSHQEIRGYQSAGVPVVVPTLSGTISDLQLHPDLVRIVVSWDRLPEAIKAGIIAMVEAVESVRQQNLASE